MGVYGDKEKEMETSMDNMNILLISMMNTGFKCYMYGRDLLRGKAAVADNMSCK